MTACSLLLWPAITYKQSSQISILTTIVAWRNMSTSSWHVISVYFADLYSSQFCLRFLRVFFIRSWHLKGIIFNFPLSNIAVQITSSRNNRTLPNKKKIHIMSIVVMIILVVSVSERGKHGSFWIVYNNNIIVWRLYWVHSSCILSITRESKK